jgi:hypothetical protein
MMEHRMSIEIATTDTAAASLETSPAAAKKAPSKQAKAASKPAVKTAAKTPVKARAKVPAKTAAHAPATTAPKPVKASTPVPAPKPVKVKAKLVRDSFTMPRADFALIDTLKERALSFKRPTKKSELLRAGLYALSALSNTQLKTALNALTPLKPGRPKQGE